MLAALSPARRRFAVVVLVVTLAIIAAVAVSVLRRLEAQEVRPVAQDRPGPVLLVPGYGGSTRALERLAGSLRVLGRDATVVALAGDGTGDLREQAEVLDAVVEDTLARTGAESVDVVGYSAGGVVARLWVRDYGGANLARRVVTLGSPHHGTGVAGLGGDLAPDQCPEACQQLVPDSDLLRALNAGDESPAGPRFISIWTADDETVTPPDSARLDGAVNIAVQSICPALQVSHGELPTEPVVTALVALELGASPPSTPSTRDCARLSS